MADYGAGPSKRIRFGDPDFEATGLKWLDDIETENAIESDEDSASESVYEPSEHDTDSEQEGENEELANLNNQEDLEDADEELVNQANTPQAVAQEGGLWLYFFES